MKVYVIIHPSTFIIILKSAGRVGREDGKERGDRRAFSAANGGENFLRFSLRRSGVARGDWGSEGSRAVSRDDATAQRQAETGIDRARYEGGANDEF
jgi:hypothetical protein